MAGNDTVPDVQLLEDGLAPTDDLFLAVRALQVLSCQVEQAVRMNKEKPQYITDYTLAT